MDDTNLAPEFTDALVSTCRAAIGDTLRSVIYFTPDAFDLLYLRQDLYAGDEERAREEKSELVDSERVGFGDVERYETFAGEPGTDSVVGEYEFTVRVFSEGYLGRIIVGGHGVILTTDDIDVDAFEELAVAIRALLELDAV
jgi:hypothetical protein